MFPDLFYTMSISYLALNEQTKALEYLRKAIDRGYDKELAIVDGNYSTLLNNKQFKEIVN